MNQNNGKELEAKSLLAKEHEKLAETDFLKGDLSNTFNNRDLNDKIKRIFKKLAKLKSQQKFIFNI